MHLAHLRLRDFRNYTRLDADFAPGFHLLLGDNAQGKTNILEAVYLMATLRSFRGVGGAQMIRHGQKGYFVGGTVVGGTIPSISLRLPQGREWGEEAEFLKLRTPRPNPLPALAGRGRQKFWPATAGVKSKSTGRRANANWRWTASRSNAWAIISACCARWCFAPRICNWSRAPRAPAGGSSICCSRKPSRPTCRCSSVICAPSAPATRCSSTPRGGPTRPRWTAFRANSSKLGGRTHPRCGRELAPKFSPLARLAYRRISNDAEELRIEYQPSVKKDFAVELAQSRNRERTYRSTLVGPHRDDLQLLLNEKSAAQFGSEGQKRTLAIALKMAQAEYLAGIHGSAPVLLIDDVMGELDVKRRSGFLPLLEQARKTGGQVFMTATEENWPAELGKDLQRWEVQAGTLRRNEHRTSKMQDGRTFISIYRILYSMFDVRCSGCSCFPSL